MPNSPLQRLLSAGLLTLLSCGSSAQGAESARVQAALDRSVRGSSAEAIVTDLATGKPLATHGSLRPRPAAPGSTLKPFFLAHALRTGAITVQDSVFCDRSLHLRGRNLRCTHPTAQQTFRAEEALAQSCNTYFAALARHLSPLEIQDVLRGAGLTMTARPDSPDERALVVLGLEDVMATPSQIAEAYRRLALNELQSETVVARGLRGSVLYGMARPASTAGVDLLGKTGTASDPGQRWTHGWFAGVVPGRFVVVIFVPKGDGGEAARLAHDFLELLR